jgi:hypothetical protein
MDSLKRPCAVVHLIQGSVEVKKREGKDDSSPALLSSPKKRLRGCFIHSLIEKILGNIIGGLDDPRLQEEEGWRFAPA